MTDIGFLAILDEDDIPLSILEGPFVIEIIDSVIVIVNFDRILHVEDISKISHSGALITIRVNDKYYVINFPTKDFILNVYKICYKYKIPNTGFVNDDVVQRYIKEMALVIMMSSKNRNITYNTVRELKDYL
jgi:hypothetical protein